MTLEPNDSHLKGEDQTTDTDGSLTIDLTSPPPLTPPTQETDTALKSNGVDVDDTDDQKPPGLDQEADEGVLQDTKDTNTDDGDSEDLESMDTDAPSEIGENLPPDGKSVGADPRTLSSAPPALVDTQALVEEEQPQKENEASDNSSSQLPQDSPSSDDIKPTDQSEHVVGMKSEQTQSDDFRDQREESPKLVIDTGTSEPVPREREREPPSIIKTNETLVERTRETSEHKPTPRLQSSSSDEMEIQLDLQDNDLSDDSASEDEELDDTRHIPTCISNTDHQKASNLHTIQSTSSAYTSQGQQTSTTASSFKETPHSHSNTTPSTRTLSTVTTIVDTPNNKHGSHSPVLVGLTSRRGGSPQSGSPSHQGGDNGSRVQKDVSPSHRIRQVAKVKQFFSTLQQFGNKMGSEAAEQVQELISAVVVSSSVL